MLQKSKLKLIKGLSLKKNRDEMGLFVAEGTKLITDLNLTHPCSILLATEVWLQSHPHVDSSEIIVINENELKQISNQRSPQGAVAVFKKINWVLNYEELNTNLTLVLDEVQDPGNLGTIIRIADWFGISNIVCSQNSADAYNPKTIQATMGAIARVKIHYQDLCEFLNKCKHLPIYGTFMDGDNVYKQSLTSNGLIVMGNEGNGISKKLENLIPNKLLIPSFPEMSNTSESLNVGVATALICGEFRRRIVS
jgi:TrmH family RNA methyltransferase